MDVPCFVVVARRLPGRYRLHRAILTVTPTTAAADVVMSVADETAASVSRGPLP